MNRRVYRLKKQFMEDAVGEMLGRDAVPNAGPQPDYSDLRYWACSPEKKNASDHCPSGLGNEEKTQKADVFYLYPTTYVSKLNPLIPLRDVDDKGVLLASMKKASWNADLSDEHLNHLTDVRAIQNQATAFNASCRVFAPLYRQAHIKAFFAPHSKPSQKAFDMAYNDIVDAFEYYLDHYNQGRPIVIATHSQGTLHGIRLLKDYFDGKPLQKQLVCAYLVGYRLPKYMFDHIPLGKSPDAIGCVVGWRSFQEGIFTPDIKTENGDSLCVNPLTWTTSLENVDKEANTGVLMGLNKLVPGEVGARIEPSSNMLWVSLAGLSAKVMGQIKNLHSFDYNLFWMNIRENVRLRVETYCRDKNIDNSTKIL